MSFTTIRSNILYFFVFVVLVFVFPYTQDFFAMPKWFLVGFIALALLLSSIGEFVFSKKIEWESREYDTPFTLFLIAGALSVLFGSVNKVQALLNPHFGLLTFLFLFIVYFYLSRSHKKLPYSNIILSLFSVLFSLSVLATTVPFIVSRLPGTLSQFANLTLAGSLFDALIVLGLFAVLSLSYLLKKGDKQGENVMYFFAFIFTTISSLVVLFTLFKNNASIILPSVAHSWYATVEVLKQPMTALFGVGMDNFSQLFLKVKDTGYNASSVWQIPSFSISRIALFHTMAEMGVFGLGMFLFILITLMRRAFSDAGNVTDKLIALYFSALFILFPPSFLLYFTFFVWLGVESSHQKSKKRELDLGEMVPVYALIILVGMVAVGGSSLLLGRIALSEYLFKQSLSTNNLKDVYEKMKVAVTYNPYNERIRSNFVQAHLLIANTVAGKAKKNEKGEPQLSETDRQTVSQAIQAAIDEAKAVVSLNPNKATNWELLATVYRSIVGVVQGADTWTVSAYQRAVVLDPQNPSYRVALGGVLYGHKQYEDASRLFETAVSIKPEWPNAQYNYAWSLYQRGEYQKAASAMQTCVSLLNPSKDAADYKKATADLAEFKTKIPPETTSGSNEQSKQPQEKSLSLPPTPAAQVEPKISLPKTASPEAPLR